MTDDEINRFMFLFRKYRDDDELPPDEREEFKRLAKAWRDMKRKDAE